MTSTRRAPDGSPRLSWRSVFDAWRGISRKQLVTALLFGAVFFLYATGGNLLVMLQHPEFGRRAELLAISLGRDVAAALALLACVAVADHIGARTQRQAAYIVAIVISAAIAGPLAMIPRAATYVLGAPGTAQASTKEFELDLFDACVGRFFEWMVLAGAATFIYVDRRRALAARERLHAAELDRTRAAKRTLESRLQAMQARVEPQFLFNTLAQVRALYGEDAGRGEHMLDELIAYLRAAMPKMRDATSTLGQEIELARAYLGIVRVRLGDTLRFTIDAPAGDGGARMPPMLLLPLVDHVIRSGDLGTAHSIAVRATVADGKLRLAVADHGSGVAFDPESADIEAIRDRLAALYGGRARLVVRGRDGISTEAALEMPLERTSPGVQ